MLLLQFFFMDLLSSMVPHLILQPIVDASFLSLFCLPKTVILAHSRPLLNMYNDGASVSHAQYIFGTQNYILTGTNHCLIHLFIGNIKGVKLIPIFLQEA